MLQLWLKDFDTRIASNMAEAAWKMFNDGKIRELREVEKHFWVAQVHPEIGLGFETEVIITPHKIRAFTCECWQENRRLMCVHIAATLLQIRHFLEQKTLEKQVEVEQREEVVAGRFTISTVLSAIEPDRLVEFVREYARRDKDFSLALKTWFAMSEDDSEQHFLQLLDSVLPKNFKKKIVEKDFRRLLRVLSELQKQLESTCEMGNALGTFHLATALLLKLKPVLDGVEESRRDAILPFLEKSWAALQHFSPEVLSPELRERQWKFNFEAAEKRLFPKSLERPLIAWLAAQTHKFEELQSLFLNASQPIPPFILQLYLAALAARGMEKAGVRVLEDYTPTPEDIHHCLVELYYLNYHQALLFLGEYFLEKQIFSVPNRRELEDLLLLTAEKIRDKKNMQKYYQIKFIRTGSFEILEKMKTNAGKKWDNVFQNLIAALKNTGDQQKIAALLANSGDLVVLAAFLENEKNLSLLQKYEIKFLPEAATRLMEIYKNLLVEYLAEHYGRPANIFVREILSGLIQKNEQRMAVEIIHHLTQHFPDRQSLAEDLSEVFPKHKRKAFLKS